MNYILLGRQLDKYARLDGYQDMPDVIINEILEYTGKIEYKPTFIYLISIRFNYDRFSWRYNEETDSSKLEIAIGGKNRRGKYETYYCSCCDRFYQSVKSHFKTQKHPNNHIKHGDILKEIDYINILSTAYNNSRRTNNIRNITGTMKEIWKR